VAKYPASKIVLSRNTTGSTYVAIGQILELGKVGSSRDLIDASAYGDTWNDYILGLQDGAEVPLVIALDPANAQHTALKSDNEAGVAKNFQLTHADFSRTLTFPALVLNYMEGGDKDGVYEAECNLKIVNPGVTVS
jgi:hypothetical protein